MSVCPYMRLSVCPSVRAFHYGYNHPHAFLKSVLQSPVLSLGLSVHPTVTLSPPKPLDEIPPNLECKMLTWMGYATAIFLGPPAGALGRGQKVCLSVCLSRRRPRYLILNHWTKSNENLCVSCLHEWGVQRHIILVLPLGSLWRVKRVKYRLISITKSISKILKPIWCHVIVVWLFLAVPWVCPRFVIVAFPDHTHLLSCVSSHK